MRYGDGVWFDMAVGVKKIGVGFGLKKLVVKKVGVGVGLGLDWGWG